MPRLAIAAALTVTLAAAGGSPAFAAEGTPGIVSTGLTDGQYVGADQVLRPEWINPGAITGVDIAVTGQDNRQYRNGEWTDGRLWLDFDDSADGATVTVTVAVYGPGGLAGSATTEVHVDTKPPAATFSPGRTSVLHGVATITVTPLTGDVVSAGLYDFGAEVVTTSTTPLRLTFDTRTTPYTDNFGLVVRDRAGNATAYDTNFRFDNAGPVVNGGVPATLPAGVSTVIVGGEDMSGVGRMDWYVDGVLGGTTKDGTIRRNWGTTQRYVTLELRMWDKLGNGPTRRSFKILIDRSGPAVTWRAPGALVRGSAFTTTVTATDPSGVQFAAYGSGRAEDRSSPYSARVSAGKDGRKTLTWYVYDKLGNRTTASRVVTVDNTRPALSVKKAPANGAKVGGTVTATLAASDRNGIARVELLVNGKVVAKDVTSGYGFTFATKPYGKKFKVTFRAYDRAGNVRSATTRTWHR